MRREFFVWLFDGGGYYDDEMGLYRTEVAVLSKISRLQMCAVESVTALV